jgi:hypothetical protein
MKKIKRIIALAGVVVLLGLYVSTLVLACIGSENALNVLRAAIYATIVLPVLLWAYSFIYRLLKGVSSEDETKDDETGDQEK